MADNPNPANASPGRASQQVLESQTQRLSCLPYAEKFLNTAAANVLILNSDRQILLASREFQSLVSTIVCARSSNESHMGLRPGEALNCIHSNETAAGCGTTEFCRVCGMNNAIALSQDGKELVQECRMRRNGPNGRVEALDLRVWARPLDIEGDRFTMVTVLDISDEKRRRALERIFFHDVLNTAGGLHGLAQVLADTELDEEQVRRTADLLCYSSEQLIEEIQAHRILTAAERNDLIPRPALIEVRSYLAQLAEAFSASEIAKDRIILVIPGEVRAETDKTLLHRVILNLLKNALEASAPGETVTVNVWQDGEFARIDIQNSAVIPEDVQLQIFNRSFSTRGIGRGWGTYSAKLLTERYLRGTLNFKSAAPDGTVFTVSVPLNWPD